MEATSRYSGRHLTELDKKVLAKLAGDYCSSARTVVEIGNGLGASACTLAGAVRRLNGRVFSVDASTNLGIGPRDAYSEFVENTQRFKGIICPIRAESTEAANQFDQEIDLLFINAEHSNKGCRRDLLCWLPKVRSRGIVALHAFDWADGVRDSIRDLVWPIQDGPGYWEGNIYWTRVGPNHDLLRKKPKTRASIILSTHNAAPLNLNCLANEAKGAEKEVCVVRTGQARVLKNGSATVRSQLRVKEFAEPVPGLLAGRHRGFREATGEILIFLDDDVRVSEGWFDAMLEPFVDPSVHLVGCRYLPNYEVEPPEWLGQLWTQTSEGRYLSVLSLLDNGPELTEISPTMIWGLCYAIRRETLIKLGGFHPDAYLWELRRYRGDGETAPSRLAKQLKLRAMYQGKAVAYHQIPKWKMTVEFFERRAYLEGISNSYYRVRREGNAPGKPTLRSRLGLLKAAAKIALLSRGTSIEAIRARITYAYQRGYAYHQSEVRRDPKLLAWVLRQDYWDYRPPDGWQK